MGILYLVLELNRSENEEQKADEGERRGLKSLRNSVEHRNHGENNFSKVLYCKYYKEWLT